MEPILKIAMHEIVANQLRRAIHRGDYMPGDRLPSERDLATRLEVSRETLREAIRMLEGEGYVVSRRGAKGGHIVTALSEPAGRMYARLRADQNNIVNLMEFQAQRAREYFRSGFQLIPYLSRRSRACPAVMGQLYSKVLERIESAGYDVLHNHIGLSKAEKLRVTAQTWFTTMLPQSPRP